MDQNVPLRNEALSVRRSPAIANYVYLFQTGGWDALYFKRKTPTRSPKEPAATLNETQPIDASLLSVSNEVLQLTLTTRMLRFSSEILEQLRQEIELEDYSKVVQ